MKYLKTFKREKKNGREIRETLHLLEPAYLSLPFSPLQELNARRTEPVTTETRCVRYTHAF